MKNREYKYYFQKGNIHYFGRGYVYHIYRRKKYNKDWEELVYCSNNWIPSIGPNYNSKEYIKPIPEINIFQLMLEGNKIYGIREKYEVQEDKESRTRGLVGVMV